MESLPLVLLIGPFLGPLVAVAVPIAVTAWMRRRMRARCRAAADRAWPEEPAVGVDAGDGELRTVVGRLMGDGDVVRFDFGWERTLATTAENAAGDRRGHATRAADGLRLELEDGRVVPIEGPVRVLRGSVERWLDRSLDALSYDSVQAMRKEAEVSTEGDWRLSVLSPGDRVRAIGVVRAEAAAEEAYRDAARQHVLTAGDDGAILLAVEGPARVRVPKRIGRTIFAIAALLGGSWGLGAAAYAAWEPTDYQGARATDPSGEIWAWLVGQSPLHRDDLALRLSRELSLVAPMSRSIAETRVAVEATRSCGEGVRAAREHGLWDRAAALADECDAEARRQVACDLGWFAEATQGLELDGGYISRGELAGLVVGDATIAARAMRIHARRERESAATLSEDGAALNRAVAEGHDCLADALEARGGDEAARGRLRATAQRNPFCRLLLADVTEGEARLAHLDALDGHEETQAFGKVAFLLRAEVAPGRAADRLRAGEVPRLVGAPVHVPASSVPLPVLREAAAAARERAGGRPEDRALTAILDGLEGVERVSLGDPVDGERRLEGAVDALDALLGAAGDRDGAAEGGAAAEGAAAEGAAAEGAAAEGAAAEGAAAEGAAAEGAAAEGAAVDAPADDAPADGADGASDDYDRLLKRARDDLLAWWAVAAAERRALEVARQRLGRIEDADAREWLATRLLPRYTEEDVEYGDWEVDRALRTGDGSAVARVTGRDPWLPSFPSFVHRVSRDRDVLAEHLRWQESHASYHCDPAMALDRLVARLRVARALDDDAWAAAVAPRIERHREALTRRAVALAAHALSHHWYVYDGR